MTTQYIWSVVNTNYNTDGGFITTVHYNVSATDGTYTASTYGTVSYTETPDQTVIPYSDLTEAEVVGWIQNSLGLDTVQDSLDTQIEAQKHPVQESGLPWSTPPATI